MLNPEAIFFLLAFAAIFWVGIFVLTSNPFNQLSRVGAGLLFVLSLFLLSGVFIFTANDLAEFRTIFRLNAFTIYLPAALWFHSSVLMLKKNEQMKWRFLIWVGYFIAIASSLLELVSDLVINYDKVIYPVSRFKFIYDKGPLFFPAVGFVVVYFLLTSKNLWDLYRVSKEKTQEWFKYLFPLATSLFFALGVALIVSTFIFSPVKQVKEAGEMILIFSVALLAINVLINRLFLDGAKANLGKEFFYSSITVAAFLAIYLAALFSFKISPIPRNLILISIFVALILITHSTYDWIMSFVRNIFYKGEVILPRVTDEEVSLALRNFRRPECLEESSLMRLKLVAVGNQKPSIDKLRDLLKEAVSYFKQDEPLRRSRSILRYEILKMISEQVEEGQILWDLGFEEYPLEIAEKGEGQKPRFVIQNPTDYQATSRNAFIALKKEAIHGLAWRISYLEKHFKG